jgi:hypothetical protein
MPEEKKISEMTPEEYDAFVSTLPCAVVDFRDCSPMEDDDELDASTTKSGVNTGS